MENPHHQTALKPGVWLHEMAGIHFLAYALGQAGGISWPLTEQQGISRQMTGSMPVAGRPAFTLSGMHELD